MQHQLSLRGVVLRCTQCSIHLSADFTISWSWEEDLPSAKWLDLDFGQFGVQGLPWADSTTTIRMGLIRKWPIQDPWRRQDPFSSGDASYPLSLMKDPLLN